MMLFQLPVLRRNTLAIAASSVVVAGFCAVAVADEGSSSAGDSFRTNQFYFGVGAGITELDPEARTDAITVGDSSSTGFSLTLGYDFTSWLSGEIYGADLGSSSIDFLGQDVGDVDYQVFGASLLGTFYRSNGYSRGRSGLSLYGRAGFGTIDNDTELDFDRDHSEHIAFGVGAEYGLRNGFAVRGELNSYDTDAQYLQVTLLKRFGGRAHQRNRPVAPIPVTPVEPAPIAPEAPVQKAQIPANLPNTYFDFDLHNLSSEAIQTVDSIASALKDVDGLILVEGHADHIGPDAYNQALSMRRANSVRDALVSRGISADRLSVRGLGERQPAATNSTDEGRALNRRVEITLRAQ